MKIGCIGDIHGRDIWKTIVNENQHIDKWIFVGDYVDSYDIDNDTIYKNFMDILYFKKSNTDNVVLLLGNHDVQYINIHYRCDGFRNNMYFKLNALYISNIDLFKYVYKYNNYLFSHAGFSKKWIKFYENNLKIYKNLDESIKNKLSIIKNINDIDIVISNIEKTRLVSNFNSVGSPRGGIETGSFLWADRSETCNNKMVDGYHQVVGHTPIKNIKTYYNSKNTASITYIDCLDSIKNFYEIDI